MNDQELARQRALHLALAVEARNAGDTWSYDLAIEESDAYGREMDYRHFPRHIYQELHPGHPRNKS